MYAQVIFFLALTLFIILLVRRFHSSWPVLGRIGDQAVQLGRSAGRVGASAGGQLVERVRKMKFKIPLVSDRHGELPNMANTHAFWQENTAETNSELGGFFDEGDELFKKGEYAQAEAFFLKAATRQPGDARVYARLGVIYLHQKNYNDAIEALKVAVKVDKYNPSRHYNLALAYMGNNNRQKAIACAREAITLDPVTKKYRQLLETLLNRK